MDFFIHFHARVVAGVGLASTFLTEFSFELSNALSETVGLSSLLRYQLLYFGLAIEVRVMGQETDASRTTCIMSHDID